MKYQISKSLSMKYQIAEWVITHWVWSKYRSSFGKMWASFWSWWNQEHHLNHHWLHSPSSPSHHNHHHRNYHRHHHHHHEQGGDVGVPGSLVLWPRWHLMPSALCSRPASGPKPTSFSWKGGIWVWRLQCMYQFLNYCNTVTESTVIS